MSVVSNGGPGEAMASRACWGVGLVGVGLGIDVLWSDVDDFFGRKIAHARLLPNGEGGEAGENRGAAVANPTMSPSFFWRLR